MVGEEYLLIWAGKAMGYVSLGVYSVLLAIFWWPALVLRKVATSFREFGVDSWPRANGSITKGNVKAAHGWILDLALGELEYTYRLRGEYYSGSMTRQFPDEQSAWDFVDSHRDEPVIVRYRDDKPEDSVLLVADQGVAWAPGPGPGLLSQVWQHLCNEIRPQAGARPFRTKPTQSIGRVR
jgi:hypothetical protein